MLYSGVAFFEFQSGNFWEGFAATLNVHKVATNEQSKLNQCYRSSAQLFDLEVTSGEYVSSAVRHIGVPLSMWEGFLRICEWALWSEGWENLEDKAWRNALIRRLGGRKRLISFLTDNRGTATEFIHEMLDARAMLRSDPKLTISDLTQALILRREYFEEVPETADFLRENDPESLFQDRARLAWEEERGRLLLHLPPVNREKLPAVWKIGGLQQAASSTATEIVVNGGAFSEKLVLALENNELKERQRIAGINGWALHDDAKGRVVQPRDALPVAQYTILSSSPLTPELKGWNIDPEHPEIDIESVLADGTRYYTTRLLPTARSPKLRINGEAWLTFTQRRNVTLRVFCGPPLEDGTLRLKNGSRFSVKRDGVLRVEDLPTPFLEVPLILIRYQDETNSGRVSAWQDHVGLIHSLSSGRKPLPPPPPLSSRFDNVRRFFSRLCSGPPSNKRRPSSAWAVRPWPDSKWPSARTPRPRPFPLATGADADSRCSPRRKKARS